MEKIFSTILRKFKMGKFFGEKTVLNLFLWDGVVSSNRPTYQILSLRTPFIFVAFIKVNPLLTTIIYYIIVRNFNLSENMLRKK